MLALDWVVPRDVRSVEVKVERLEERLEEVAPSSGDERMASAF